MVVGNGIVYIHFFTLFILHAILKHLFIPADIPCYYSLLKCNLLFTHYVINAPHLLAEGI